MAFVQAHVSEITAAAEANLIPTAAFLAVVEIESNGVPFEPDGATPRFLFEKAQFYKQLKADPRKLQAAVAAGLAQPSWSRDYSDQKYAAARMKLLQRARAIDAEAGNRAASWGLGQIMGFNAVGLGYASATAMVEAMSASGRGVEAQLEAMARYITSRNLTRYLAARDCEGFALRYNGSGYAANGYHLKLANAYAYWSTRTSGSPGLLPDAGGGAAGEPQTLCPGSRGAEVTALQRRLTELGYPLGAIDGAYGNMTASAVFAFQSENGLRATGIAGPETIAALPGGKPMPIAEARRSATETTLKALGSRVIAETSFGRKLAQGTTAAGALGLFQQIFGGAPAPSGGFATGPLGAIGQAAQDLVGGGNSALAPIIRLIPTLLGPGHGLPLVAAGLGLMLFRSFSRLAAERRSEHAEGLNRGF